jgi:DNA processing protein
MVAERSREFWQRFLRAEISSSRSRAILDSITVGPTEIDQLTTHPLLSERERFLAATQLDDRFNAAIDRGIAVATGIELPNLLTDVSPALYYWGDLSVIHRPTVGIVGTRRAGTYGKACAAKFAEALARAGATVISGGALGVDGAAHEGALRAGGKTVAVLATGVDTVYPAVHAGLFDRIRDNGALVSQYAIGSRADEFKFLARNYLIAAMSQAVIVIEAPHKSGSLRTAHDAADLGKEVFVVPSTIDNPNYFGSFRLIEDGATLLYRPEQVIDFLGLTAKQSPHQPALTGMGELADKILAALPVEPISTEILLSKLGLDPGPVLAELTLLELDGKVIREGNGYARLP